MTRDRETGEGELVYAAAERLWREVAADAEGDRPSVTDLAIAHETGIELEHVRRWLDEATGPRLTVKRYGETRVVEALAFE